MCSFFRFRITRNTINLLHVFAISGLHIALLATIVVELLRFTQLPRWAVGALVLPVVWLYTAATGNQPSAVRATLMTTVVVGGWMLCRPPDLLNSLAGAGLAILAWDPRQLFQPGFQLSFAVVGAIAVLARPIEEALRHIAAPDPLLPEEFRPDWQERLRRLWFRIAAGLSVSLAAWIGSMPLSAYLFHLFTPGSLVANLIVVPASTLALAAGVASLACGPWWPRVE